MEAPKVVEKKKYSIDDIQNAQSLPEVLDAYRNAQRGLTSYDGTARLQEAVADKAHELGDEESSLQFTLLASHTKNNEMFLKGVSRMMEVTDQMQKTGYRIEQGSEDFGRAAKIVMDASEQFRADAGRISTAGNQMDRAAGTINEASYRMQNR